MRKAQSRAVIDHLVFGCEQLETGTAYLERVIGKDFVVGGKHDLMTTHNKLLRLQGSVYLESIAIDFKAAKAKGDIGRKRWFSLDDTRTRQKLAIAPYPLTWVVAVDNVDEAIRVGESIALFSAHRRIGRRVGFVFLQLPLAIAIATGGGMVDQSSEEDG